MGQIEDHSSLYLAYLENHGAKQKQSFSENIPAFVESTISFSEADQPSLLGYAWRWTQHLSLSPCWAQGAKQLLRNKTAPLPHQVFPGEVSAVH